MRKFYWNKKNFNVKKFGAARLQNLIRKKSVPNKSDVDQWQNQKRKKKKREVR